MAGRSASGSWFGYFGVVHADVEVQLLRVGRVGPARRDPFGNALECQLPQAKLGAYDHPVTEIFVHPHPERLAVNCASAPGSGQSITVFSRRPITARACHYATAHAR